MAFAEDFVPGQGEEFEEPQYPQAFGITLTPTVIGIIIAVLGLAGAIYMFLQLVQPKIEEYQSANTEVEEKKAQLQNIEALDQTNCPVRNSKQQKPKKGKRCCQEFVF